MKRVPFHQDNAPVQKYVVAMAAMCDHDCETGLPSSVFQDVHEMSVYLLLFKFLNYLSSVGLSGRKQCSYM